MISHQYKCIFIHIPKCAGTSRESALGHLDGHTGRGGQDHRTIRMIEPLSIQSFIYKDNLLELTHRLRYRNKVILNPNNKITVTKKEYYEYFKFTVVRNPWARAYSWYQNVIRDEHHRKTHNITKDISFNQFLKKFLGKGMLKPQIDYLKDFKGNIAMDYIIYFEDLENGFNTVKSLLNLPTEISLPHKIKGSTDQFYNAYNEENKRMIFEQYKEEIALFNYSFPEK